MMTIELPKSYTPGTSESEIRKKWDDAGAFHATPDAPPDASGEPYCIVIPPPNVTAPLHLGHAFNNTLQDILCRYHRMRGYNVLWMPGTDHAGIATQTVVEKRLLQQGIKRRELGREAFVEKVQAWKDEYEATIIEQLQAMGCSCDWDRVRFTMDPMCGKAVREAFFRLFKDGLIYRGKRLVNWDPVTLTALADDEVEMKDVQGHMWYLRYPLEDGSGHVTVATTRPETMLGDTAVAINPKDPRAESLRGKRVRLPIVGRMIPIVEDPYVVLSRDMGGDPADAKSEFATGFLKVTPAHDPNDWEIGRRHDLDVINILAPDASISNTHGWDDVSDEAMQFVGKSREDARKAIVKWFKNHDLLEEIKDYAHSVGHSYRSHVPIEPYLSDQWYMKVSDDRLVGEAQRALSDEQFEGDKPPRLLTTPDDLLTSRDRKGAIPLPTSRDRKGAIKTILRTPGITPLNECAYFITFTCYGNWLHADARGSVDPSHNLPGTPVLLGDEQKERSKFESLQQEPMSLNASARRAVQEAIVEVCAHRNWRLIALHVRTNHVHCIVIADTTPERVMIDFKAYATRRLREKGLVDGDRHVWTRHGSTRYLNDDASVLVAITYVTEQQGETLDPAPIVEQGDDGGETLPYGRGSSGGESLPDGRGSSGGESLPYGRGSLRGGDGELNFYPPRYARTYQSWHDNLRDWCISRQLWWGHRIPVWILKEPAGEQVESEDEAIDSALAFERLKKRWESEDRIAILYREKKHWGPLRDINLDDFEQICIKNEDDIEVINRLESEGFKQDPDVLDTWFSSGLWPISTMGWPDPEAFPETEGLLDTFNPSTVLVTGRDIITLWVSRMVMFNRYLRDGVLPFREVYINPMIQDGHGQRMSKSLGNGVDPRDIIHSHGADALRFTLCQIATSTQDVRLPVDMICPACEHEFDPKMITSPAEYRVAAPEQACPKCEKELFSAYGVATGLAVPTKEKPLAMNSSTRFDLGRNFANKLWNAVRFALGNLTGGEVDTPPMREWKDTLPLADRWIITRLHRTLRTVENAVANYQFSVYAETMYDFIWRDFCDWYLEAIKPTVKENPIQQQVLRTVLNAILRLLHPICPFVTEALWPHVQAAGSAGMDGITLPPNDLLARADWPEIDDAVEDGDAAELFERVRNLTEEIRKIRGEKQVSPKKKIDLLASEPLIKLIHAADGMVQTIAGLESVEEAKKRPAEALTLTFEGEQLFLTGLSEAIDVAEEHIRQKKLVEELQKTVAGYRNKLQNDNYVKRAPSNVVQETRQRLAQAQRDLVAAEKVLESLPT